MMQELVLGIGFFILLIMVLTTIILLVRGRLLPAGKIKLCINSQRTLETENGRKLLDILAGVNLLLPSACGGRGTCGQCKLIVNKGGGAVLPTETALLEKNELKANVRLACQLVARYDLEITIPEEVFGVKKWLCTLRKSRNISTFIRELVMDLPEGEELDFRAGGYIMVDCPPFQTLFSDFDIDTLYRNEWDRFDMWRYKVISTQSVSRAYSLANYPDEKNIAMLNVRIAIPPPGSNSSVPPGIVSSYLYSLKPGDQITLYGPYGHFFARNTDKEMVFIGGGAGMAPMRSHIFDQLLRIKSTRKISFWYGARSRQEIFYEEDFISLDNKHPNFSWHISLSDPKPTDKWAGSIGLIHKVVYDEYLKEHPAPELCEYYICGPPLMNSAVIKMLEDLGVERQDILLDDFGT